MRIEGHKLAVNHGIWLHLFQRLGKFALTLKPVRE